MPSLVAFALWACSGQAALTWQDQWELLALDRDLSILDVRLGTSSTGTWRGAGLTWVTWAPRGEPPLDFDRLAPPPATRVDAHGATIGGDRLAPPADHAAGEVHVRSDQTSLQLTLDRALPGPAAGAEAWHTEVVAREVRVRGAFAQLEGRALVNARGVLLRRRGDRPPALTAADHHAFYVVDEDLAVGFDRTGDVAVAWARVGDVDLDTTGATLALLPTGTWEATLNPVLPLVVRLQPRAPVARSIPRGPLSGPERWLLSLVGREPQRLVRGADARVHVAGRVEQRRAIVVTVTW